jgi:hypothetical protein
MANGTVLMDPSIRRSALLGRQAAMKHVRGSVTLLLLPFSIYPVPRTQTSYFLINLMAQAPSLFCFWRNFSRASIWVRFSFCGEYSVFANFLDTVPHANDLITILCAPVLERLFPDFTTIWRRRFAEMP